jgi:hypothetical protein
MNIKLYEEAKKRYDGELFGYEIALSKWKKAQEKKKGEKPTPPQEPICRRYMCNDITIEAIAVLLQNNPRGVLLYSDELSGWIEGFNQYKKGGRGSDCAHWLSMHGAKPLLVDRKIADQGIIHVPRAAVSVTGGIQPEILQRVLGQEHFYDGLAARLLMAMPLRIKRVWTNEGVPIKVQRDLVKILDYLFEFQPFKGTDKEKGIIDLKLTPDAQKLFVEFFNQHGQEQMDLYGPEAAAWSKLEGYAARFAMVIHLARVAAINCMGDSVANDGSAQALPVDSEPKDVEFVDRDSMAAAIELCEWFKSESLRVYALIGERKEHQQLRNLREIIRLHDGKISVRDWQRIQHHDTAEDARSELSTLIDADLGYWEPPTSSPTGGRPTEAFCLCDTVTGDKTPESNQKTEILSESGKQILENNLLCLTSSK